MLARAHAHTHTHTHTPTHTYTHAHTRTHARTHTHTHRHTHMYKRAQSTHKLPVHSAKGFANFSASLAMLPPTCLWGLQVFSTWISQVLQPTKAQLPFSHSDIGQATHLGATHPHGPQAHSCPQLSCPLGPVASYSSPPLPRPHLHPPPPR